MLPEIVKRALVEPICDIGQLTAKDKYTLNKYVKKGYLSKGRGGPFPKIKTLYARPDFDFAADRNYEINQALALHELERVLQLGPYHPIFGRN